MDDNVRLGIIGTLISSLDREQLAGALVAAIEVIYDGFQEPIVAHVEELLKIGASQSN